MEIEHDPENGYKMGVYLCIGQQVYNCSPTESVHIDQLRNFAAIHEYIEKVGKIFLFLGEGQHKIKRKAEQIACNEAIQKLDLYSGSTAE